MKEKTITRGIEIIAVGEESILKALTRVAACQGCSLSVSRSFGSVLIEALSAASPMTEFVMCEPAPCPNCGRPMIENTLVRCEGDREDSPVEAMKQFEPDWNETNVVLIDEVVLAQAQSCISGCEHCVVDTETTFDYVLDAVTGCDPAATAYVLCVPAECPRCGHEVTEKTFIM